MFLLVRYLIKLLSTSGDWAGKGLLCGMYSEMIKEVVPFSKEFATISMITSEYASQAAC